MRLTLPSLLAAGTSLAILVAAAPARADASAWAFVGGGALGWKQVDTGTTLSGFKGAFNTSGTMTIDVGAGTSPDGRFIVGGLFRVQPIFGHGADLALLARGCSHGFQAGDWGFAVDAGAYLRTWGPAVGGGFAGSVSLGMPLGFTLSVQTEIGTNSSVAVGAVAGVDLLRLTVYRQTLQNWWQNPVPAWTRSARASSGAGLEF